MELDDARVFAKVVESGSFTKAAQLLGIPKSTASRRVSDLEERLGARLLQRTTRTLHLTHAGEVYFARISRVVEEMLAAEQAVLELQQRPRGILRITTPGDLNGTMPALIADFHAIYPEVELVVFSTTRKVDLVAEGYDLALRAGIVADSSLVQRILYRSHLSLFASPEYVREKGPIRHPRELVDHRCIIFSNERLYDTWHLIGPEGSLDVEVSGRLATGDFSLVRGAAAASQGIAFMPDLAGVAYARDGRLVHVLPEYRSQETMVSAVYPSPRHLSPKVRAFIDFSVKWLSERVLAV